MKQTTTVRAKCLQYKKSGNELTEKVQNLHKFAEGVYYAEGESWNGQPENTIFFECGGVYWRVDALHPNYMEEYRERIENMRANFFANVQTAANSGKYIRLLEIEVFRRCGYDVAPLLSARSEYLKKQEQEEQRKAEERERKERERAEQEAKEKAEKVADGVAKLQEKRGEIATDALELIADKYGVSMHGRTRGMMRDKLRKISYINGKMYLHTTKNTTTANIYSLSDFVNEIEKRVTA